VITRHWHEAGAFQVNTIATRREQTMMVRWFLFETRCGEWLLTLLERRLGLAVVSVEWLAVQPSGVPQVVSGE
jgi:hypothetical protein